MLVTEETLQKVDNHWAVLAVGKAKRDRGLEVAKAKLVHAATSEQMELDFERRPGDAEILDRLSMAYEVAAIEGLGAALHPGPDPKSRDLCGQCYSGAWRAFELRSLLPIPEQDEQRIFHILHLSALAYCGDRWSDLRRWMSDHEEYLEVPSVAGAEWDRRLLIRIFDCWIRMLRKRSWDDINAVAGIIASLRDDQSEYERGFLSSVEGVGDRAMAFRLIAIYHWAKATELLAVYLMQGMPPAIAEELDKHFESSRKAAALSQDAPLEMLQRWLHIAAKRMVAGSVWWVARAVNSQVMRFVENVTKGQAMFELLPPQRVALQEQGLLDQAHRAIIVEMPTSGGKTLLAQFRMLQALNQFAQDGGWVAYVAPTRALVAQITRRLRRDFGPLGIAVEALTSAIEIDAFEEQMLTTAEGQTFDILVATPEKLHLVIRNKKVPRPLALVVMDEAHNMEDSGRGMRIELLLATIRRECEQANFLLLMPYVPNSEEIAHWLAPDASRTISIGTGVWKPNERIIGLYQVKQAEGRGNWTLEYETLVTSPKTVGLDGRHQVGDVRPISISFSEAKSSFIAQTAAMATVFSKRGTSIAVANTIPNVWSMARLVARELPPYGNVPGEIALVQRFLAAEISPKFELIDMLDHGVAVHHAGLPDEVRALIEWLAEEGLLRVLCATTTISQGINFPVASVFLASINHRQSTMPFQVEMGEREFWNLAGRAGRVGQDTLGVIGVATNDEKADALKAFVSRATGRLVSRLIRLLDEVEEAGRLNELHKVIAEDQWRDFRCYVAHLWAEKKKIEAVLADTEQLLRNTFGYFTLRSDHSGSGEAKAEALLKATKSYVKELAEHPENAILADATGFAPEGVSRALMGLGQLEDKLSLEDWEPGSLFGDVNKSSLPNLIGIMLNVPELHGSFKEITRTGKDKTQLAEITTAWVNGLSIPEIAKRFFVSEKDMTGMITDTCKAIYRTIVNTGPWGLAALSKMPTSGLDFEDMPEDVRRRLNVLPAMIYHGVSTEEAVLMRVNSVPRSIAEPMAKQYKGAVRAGESSVIHARRFIKSLGEQDWNSVVPDKSPMSGADYREVWRRLAGE